MNFSSKNRLLSKNDFQSVFAQPYKLSRKFLTVLYIPNQQHINRLGIVISKRYLPRAVDRNQLRRIMRESFRHAQHEMPGLDIVILVRSNCTPIDKKALRGEIDRIWPALVIPANSSLSR